MATILTENFNSLNDGDANGQGSWSGSTAYDIQTSIKKEGTKAMVCQTAGDLVINTDGSTARKDGKQSFYIYPVNHSNWGSGKYQSVVLVQISPYRGIYSYFRQTGYVTVYDGGTESEVSVGSFNDDVWNLYEIEWRSSDYKFRARINSGTWSSWLLGYGGNWSDVGLIRVSFDHYIDSTDAVYFDYFAEEPLTYIKTIDNLSKSSIKTVNGLDIASMKKFNNLE